MFNYFTSGPDDTIKFPIKKYASWDRIKKQYLSELNKVKEYYRNRPYNYPNNNLFIRLIKTLSRNSNLSALEYLTYIDADAEYIIKQFKFVSNRNSGTILDNVLFEGNSKELFLYVDDAIDPMSFEYKWREYASIRVIKTDISNTEYPMLFGYDKYTQGITVFEVDVKAIMLQYYYWRRERIALDRDDNVNVFFPTVVIPNISDSLCDHAVWNRLNALYDNAEIIDNTPKHPIALMSITKRIDDVLSEVIYDNMGTSKYLTQLLKNIPAISKDNMFEVLQISKSYYNRQSKWVLWVSRLNDIIRLYKMLGKRGVRKNRDLFNRMPYEVRVIRRRKTAMYDKLDPYNAVLFDEDLDYINDNIGKR